MLLAIMFEKGGETMGKFDGYLIASDIDGTFKGRGDHAKAITDENFRAAQYFIENGGRFTFITGRTVDFLLEMGFLPIINAPACLYNGAIIYDYQKGQAIRETWLEYSLHDFLNAIAEKIDAVKTVHFYPQDTREIGRYNVGEPYPEDVGNLPKIICTFENPELAAEFAEYAKALPLLKDTYICRSWSVGVEFNAAHATKGHALQFIKEYLGDIHTAIGIGDYENDVKLLEMADIGVAVGDGIQAVKDVADWVVKPCAEYAVRDLIERLETRIDCGLV